MRSVTLSKSVAKRIWNCSAFSSFRTTVRKTSRNSIETFSHGTMWLRETLDGLLLHLVVQRSLRSPPSSNPFMTSAMGWKNSSSSSVTQNLRRYQNSKTSVLSFLKMALSLIFSEGFSLTSAWLKRNSQLLVKAIRQCLWRLAVGLKCEESASELTDQVKSYVMTLNIPMKSFLRKSAPNMKHGTEKSYQNLAMNLPT